MAEIIENGPVVCGNLFRGFAYGYMDKFSLSEKVVECDMDQAGGLAHAGTCYKYTKISFPQTTLRRIIEDFQRAYFNEIVSNHRSLPLLFHNCSATDLR